MNRHIQAVHEGIKHLCPHCDYKATPKDDLRNHIKSVHEGKNILVFIVIADRQRREVFKRRLNSAHECV